MVVLRSEQGTTEVSVQPQVIENLEEIEVKYWCSPLSSYQ